MMEYGHGADSYDCGLRPPVRRSFYMVLDSAQSRPTKAKGEHDGLTTLYRRKFWMRDNQDNSFSY